ncbi:MAG: hypothetical protein FJ109_13830 [Deltaproteobacteria bacterium]|nr:hypothetical protein [Deltaproteobacteria bacterium]
MQSSDGKQNWDLWGVAAIVTVAVLAGLAFKGFSGETLADAVKDIGAVLVPILAATLAARLVVREMDPGQRFFRAGEEALIAVQRRNPAILSGPKPDKENYDPENPGKAGRYLFFQKNHTGLRSQLIPVLPFKIGVVEIRVAKRTLQLLGTQTELEIVSGQVRQAVTAMLEREWSGLFEILETKNANVSIVIDFDEAKMGHRAFRKAVGQCAEAALEVLLRGK